MNANDDLFAEQTSSPVSENASPRLEASEIYQILNTLPENAFDKITGLASGIFEVPLCILTFAGSDRQWFNSTLDENIAALPIHAAFCTYTLEDETALVVPDATHDPRFASHSLVQSGPQFRFYAGAPLITPQGSKIGVLSLLDRRPRDLDNAARENLCQFAALVMDEIELHRTQFELSDKATYFRALIENSDDIISVLDADGIILYESSSIEKALGYSPHELLGCNAFDLVHPDDHAVTKEWFQECLSNPGSDPHVEFRYKHRDGSWRSFQARGALLPDFSPQPSIVVNSHDITSQQKAAAELHESQIRRGAMIEAALDAIVTINAEGILLEWNNAAERIFGYTREEALGRDMTQLIIPPSMRDLHHAGVARYLVTGEKHALDKRLELPAIRKDGSEIVVELMATRLPTEGPPLFSGFIRDITQSKQIEERLRLLESVAVHAHDAILITQGEPINEPGPIIVYANEAFTRETGYSLEEVLGKTPRILQGPDTDRAPRDAIRAALENWESVVVELLNYRKDGSQFWVELSIVPVADEKGWYTHWVSVQRNITERKMAQQQLQKAKDAAEVAQLSAETANRAKSEFLSRMSHELRTPLNAILGFSQIMQMEPMTADHQEMVGDIMGAGKHLLSLINEVLDIARIESGQLALSPEPVEISEVVGSVISIIAPMAAARSIAIIADEIQQTPRWILADRQRLAQSLLNLLSNAVKYNREGGSIYITCHSSQATLPDEAPRWRIEIRDTGVGIKPENMYRLFTAFDRLGAENTSVEGTGLGLALSRQLIELMNGQLNVESVEGVGSTFTVELPACLREADILQGIAADSDLEISERTGTVLYIEDNPRNVKVIESIFTRRPHLRLITTFSAIDGLKAATEYLPDLIFLDLHLPDMDGGEVLRRLKDDPQTKDIPVLVLSADATTKQIERMREIGALDYLTKPLDVPQLLQRIDVLFP